MKSTIDWTDETIQEVEVFKSIIAAKEKVD